MSEPQIDESVKALLDKNGVTVDEVVTYGRTKYPQYLSNLRIIALTYLNTVKGIKAEVAQTVKVKDLELDKNCTIRVLLASKTGEVSYVGCPECLKGAADTEEGMDITCEKCSVEVKAVKHYWTRYLAGDDTADVIVSFAPRVRPTEDLSGKVVEAWGGLRENRSMVEFVINRYSIVGAPAAASSPPTTAKPKPKSTATPPAVDKEVEALTTLASPVVTPVTSTNINSEVEVEWKKVSRVLPIALSGGPVNRKTIEDYLKKNCPHLTLQDLTTRSYTGTDKVQFTLEVQDDKVVKKEVK